MPGFTSTNMAKKRIPAGSANSSPNLPAKSCSDATYTVRARKLQSASISDIENPRQAHSHVGLRKAQIRLPNEILHNVATLRTPVAIPNSNPNWSAGSLPYGG